MYRDQYINISSITSIVAVSGYMKHSRNTGEPGECCLMSVREYMWVRPGEIWPVYKGQYINISSITSIVAVSGYMKHSRNIGGIR